MNDLIKQAESHSPGIVLRNRANRRLKAFESVVIGPDKDFVLGSPLVANESLIKKRMEHGYERAEKIEFS